MPCPSGATIDIGDDVKSFAKNYRIQNTHQDQQLGYRKKDLGPLKRGSLILSWSSSYEPSQPGRIGFRDLASSIFPL